MAKAIDRPALLIGYEVESGCAGERESMRPEVTLEGFRHPTGTRSGLDALLERFYLLGSLNRIGLDLCVGSLDLRVFGFELLDALLQALNLFQRAFAIGCEFLDLFFYFAKIGRTT